VAAGALGVHHVVKRAQRGLDFDLDRLVALCPPCHAQTEAPYARGRLVITPLGDGCFTVEVIRGGAFHSPRSHARVRRPTQGATVRVACRLGGESATAEQMFRGVSGV
jgi:hypothetical protein